VLEALRQVLGERRITVARARLSQLPADFQLVAAANPRGWRPCANAIAAATTAQWRTQRGFWSGSTELIST
jgi:predicted ATPase with chaperone activity